ncbi:MAG TPA: prolyl oligopeptidase family serine peptidase [Tepidisphaeraceae bacterium]|jgi:dipeptidyl aminopeptidase/acylaminoacyl peptidase
MTKQQILETAWIGEKTRRGATRGVIVNFHGLGGGAIKRGADHPELEWGHAGGLVVYPYYGPWSWMNRQARQFVNQLITSVYREYEVEPNVPLIITGGSMGGLSSLLYTRYSPHRIAACAALAPVCDLKYHFSERPDLPPTIRHAFRGYPEDIETLFAEHSPLQQAAGTPDIPYLLIHGDQDEAVNKSKHSDRFVAAMRGHGKHVEYMEVPGMGHFTDMPYEAVRRHVEFVTEFLKRG